MQAKTTKKTVRISLEQNKLLQLLDEYAEFNGFEVYIGKVDYSFEKREIKSIYLQSSPYYRDYFPDVMRREHYLSLMLLKRKAFNYENEVRLFLVKDNIHFDENNLLKIPCDYRRSGIISNVMLSPYPPVRAEGDMAFKIREKVNILESNEIKSVLNAKLGCRIQQSLLYQVYPRIKNV